MTLDQFEKVSKGGQMAGKGRKKQRKEKERAMALNISTGFGRSHLQKMGIPILDLVMQLCATSEFSSGEKMCDWCINMHV